MKVLKTHHNIPEDLVCLMGHFSEYLPAEFAMEWPEKFLEAIPVGVDLSMVVTKFLHWLLVDPVDGAIKFAKGEQDIKGVWGVADLLKKKMNGGEVTHKEWKVAKDGADVDYVAFYVIPVGTAAYAHAGMIAKAAYLAPYAIDGRERMTEDEFLDARAAIYTRQAEKLLELLRGAPVEIPT